MLSFFKKLVGGTPAEPVGEVVTTGNPVATPSSSAAHTGKDFSILETVSTVYGTGYISEIRSDCYVVLLTHWALAQGQSPTLYLQKDAMKKIPGALKGSTVNTPYGVCRVESIRGDGTHICRPLNWKLAGTSIATLYLQPEQVSLTQTSGLEEGDEVMTVYGQGFIEKHRGADVVVKLRNWALAQGQSPTCHLEPKACTKIHHLRVGDVGKTVWGLVRVDDIRRDGTHCCTALHWTLADGKAARMYLAPEAFALMSLKP